MVDGHFLGGVIGFCNLNLLKVVPFRTALSPGWVAETGRDLAPCQTEVRQPEKEPLQNLILRLAPYGTKVQQPGDGAF